MSRNDSRWVLATALSIGVAVVALGWILLRAPSAAVVMALLAAGVALLLTLLLVRPQVARAGRDEADETARLRSQLAIARQRQSLSNRVAAMGQWDWRLDDDTVWWSPEVAELYGLAAGSEPRTLADTFAYLHPDDHQRLRDFAAQCRRGQAVAATQFRIRRPDGGVRSIAVEATPEQLEDGRTIVRGVQRDLTALIHARRRLQLAEAQYRFLFEHHPVSMWVFDRDTLQLLAVNEEVVKHFDFEAGHSTGPVPLTMLDFNDADQPEVQEARRRGAASEGGTWAYRRRDGTTQHSAMFTQQIDFAGRPATLVAAQDVSDRERQQNLYQQVADATTDGIYEWDISRNALWISDSFFEVFGYERSTFAPTIGSWRSRIDPDDTARVMGSFADAVKGGSTWDCEYAFRRGDGSFAIVRHRGFFLRDGEGRAVRMVGGLIDLTERRRAASDLRLLRRAVEAANTGIIITESSGEQPIVYVNHGFETMTGYASSEVLGRSCRFLQGDLHDQAGVLAIRQALAEQREVQVTVKNFRKSGDVFWNDLNLSPLQDETGRVTHYIGVLSDVTERHRYEEQLAYRATHDELTSLPNRQLLIDRLSHAIEAARRRDGTVTVVFVDVDNFKFVNDTMGHATGDLVLRVAADRLAAVLRGTDTAGRFGGDEFVLVLEDDDGPPDVEHLIERVCSVLSAPIDLGGSKYVLTTSIGYCSYPADGSTADALLLHADIAMYHAKRRGRNQAAAYSPDFHQNASARLQLVARLREALDHNEFSLVFQPLFLQSGEPVALEALVRWDHPEKGRLLPAAFIDVCEESGLIVDLERCVLASAATYHQRLVDARLGHIRIAVNVSSTHFIHDLYTDVESVIERFDIPRGALELELTESVIMTNLESAIETMTRLASLGVSTTVDDFGTGYSSLAYLKRLPIERVKIDRAFVRDLGSDLGDRSICESIISLARSMDLLTVAEGVETSFQHDWLKDHGVDEFQGFLLGRPVPFEEVVTALGRYQ